MQVQIMVGRQEYGQETVSNQTLHETVLSSSQHTQKKKNFENSLCSNKKNFSFSLFAASIFFLLAQVTGYSYWVSETGQEKYKNSTHELKKKVH